MAEVSTPVYYEAFVKRGADFQLIGQYKDDDGNAVDLSGCTGALVVAYTEDDLVDDDAEKVYEASSEDADPPLSFDVDGYITIDIPATDLIDTPATGEGKAYEQYYWHLIMTYADGSKECVYYGPWRVV